MAHTLTKILIHAVFSTKERCGYLKGDLVQRTCAYVAGIAANHKFHLVRGGGQSDHLHLLLQFRPDMDVAEAMRLIKANSTNWLKTTFPALGLFSWQTGYAAFSALLPGLPPRPGMAQLCSNRSQHRPGMARLLRKHQIVFQEEYLD
jgi:REP element-mobilizing transposase RayT